ncbi:ATP-binding protein [Brevibacillus ruminantium]|uniref:histidine kinase n=1 Tax=Brevibacillus ruminantium TaxID=2950604 RepID=A0ABY4WE24_9BACL|nr:ATP-binding protein [Brevibacillus ruminantium]USG64994.1 ATP-binding protein [Brevibacillus ruminantium]
MRDDVHLSQLASVGQIAAGIAHEVKNPLTAVKGFLQLLKESHDEMYVEIAQAELQNALGTLENLLHVAKPDLENEPKQLISLSVELQSLIHLFQDQIYRVQIQKHLSDTEACVYGKKNQLKKALFNLLKNAFEAIPEKGTITIQHQVENEMVVVSIEDTGTGIPPEKISMLGTPFFTTKVEGTGMGLAQVFSVIYQHGGQIQVFSKEGEGTKFVLSIPLETTKLTHGVIRMDLQVREGEELRDFFINNRDAFEESLLREASNVKGKIEEIKQIGNINLLSNAHKLVLYIVDGREHEVVSFAQEEGVNWAKNSLTLAFKLEWIQAIRRVLWDFLYNYDRLNGAALILEHFYSREKQINELVDHFLNYFFISYSQYKDQLLNKQRELVDHLSVPLIPLTASMSILPLVGAIDNDRVAMIGEKVIGQIGESRIEVLILDLSGVSNMEGEVIHRFLDILDGISMMGCQAVITGLRPEIVKVMIQQRISFDNKAITKGTLQQALVEYLYTKA